MTAMTPERAMDLAAYMKAKAQEAAIHNEGQSGFKAAETALLQFAALLEGRAHTEASAAHTDEARMTWIGKGNMFDVLADIDVHERSLFYAHLDRREEPNDQDHANAARDAFDVAMGTTNGGMRPTCVICGDEPCVNGCPNGSKPVEPKQEEAEECRPYDLPHGKHDIVGGQCGRCGYVERPTVEPKQEEAGECDVCKAREGRHYTDCILVSPRPTVEPSGNQAIPEGWCPICGDKDGEHKSGCQDGSEVL